MGSRFEEGNKRIRLKLTCVDSSSVVDETVCLSE